MHERPRTNMERILGHAPDAMPLLTVSWAGREYAISQVKNVRRHQEGEAISYYFWATDGVDAFEIRCN